MADAGADRLRRFRWNISNLFVPRWPLEATFYVETPTLRRWQVTFEPLARQINRWPFLFSLRNRRFGEQDEIFVADKMQVIVSANGNVLADGPDDSYSFSPANQYTYQLPGNLPSTEVSHDVTIEIQLSFPNQNIGNQRSSLVAAEEDLYLLVEDLQRLLDSNLYTDLRLISRVPYEREYFVHSCILRARWSNFFSVHPERDINDDTVALYMSNGFMPNFRRYVYTSLLDINRISRNLEFKTELFQVIDLYMIHHLYKVFVVDESRQLRHMAIELNTYVESFRLDGPPWGDRFFTWIVNIEDGHRLAFQIQFSLSRRVPSFDYTWHSECPYRLFAHVKLELEFKPEEETSRFHTVHGRDYTIEANQTIRSGDSSFEGIEQRLIDEFFRRRGRSRRGIEHFIRCTIHTFDGTGVIEIQTEDYNGELGHHRERAKVLSDHMYEMLKNPVDADFQLSCPAGNPNIPYRLFDLHRSIFTARVPGWRDVLENAQEWDDLHATATCITSGEAFRYIVIYIYTGKLFPIPARYLQEIHDFADRGGLRNLKDFATPRPKTGRYL